MAKMTYEEARDLIQDGDIVFIHGTWRKPLQALVMFFTHSKFSHVCMAFKVNTGVTERVMCVEAQGFTKRRILNLSYYGDREVTVLAAPVPWYQIEDRALAKVGIAQYSILGAIYVGIRDYVLKCANISLPTLDIPHEICSEFIAKMVGLEKTEISPQTLYEELLKQTEER